jgi:hypothetical protein
MTRSTLERRAQHTRLSRALILIGLSAGLTADVFSAPASDPVMDWNDIAREFIVVPALAPVEQTRAMAIVHVAVHDAVNAITGRYEQYKPGSTAPAGTSLEAATISAAYTALAGTVGSSDALSSRYAASLAAYSVSPMDPGLAFGKAVAEEILALRHPSVDGSGAARFAYTAPGAGDPGVWTPVSAAAAAQALLPGWGSVTPWVLRSGSQFRPDAPPARESEQYARDYNEVREIGAFTSALRSEIQTQIALFWRASPTAIWNPVLRQAVRARGLSLVDTARVMALFYMAGADAGVACWDAKYSHNFWRPQAAIVNGDVDDNEATIAEPGWTPRVPTAPHPEYPSGHTSNSAAMASVLQAFFGDDPGFVIEATSSQAPGLTRRWATFSEGVDEVIDARVYSGIHFRTSDEVGARLGRQVAQFTLTHALRPVRGPRELP